MPIGLDATVSWGGPEFRFVNNRDFPIKIEAKVTADNKKVEMRIIGSDIDGSYVKMSVGSWEVFDEEYEDVTEKSEEDKPAEENAEADVKDKAEGNKLLSQAPLKEDAPREKKKKAKAENEDNK